MSFMTPLIESLLAAERPGGGKLCRMGVVQTTGILPPGFTATFQFAPYFNAYCNIEFWHAGSPSIVPGSLTFASHGRGMELQLNQVNELSIREGTALWLEVTIANPILTTITNDSELNQYFETLDFFLIVDTKSDLQAIRDIVAAYQGQKK